MIIKSLSLVPAEPVTEQGVKGVIRQIVLSPSDGAPNFTMRCFTVEPGGYTYYHSHDYEHEIFILKGQGMARGKDSEQKLVAGDAVLVMPLEVHQILNPYSEPLVFLCLIPNTKL